MISFNCSHESAKRHGKDRKGNQRYRCNHCGRTFTDEGPRALGDMRIDRKMAELALHMILEGNSIRSTERMTGLHRDTICKLVVLIGQRCETLMRRLIHNVNTRNVEMDEAWGYVYAKQKTANAKNLGRATGDAYVFTAIDRDTKLILAYHVGKRDGESTERMIWKLNRATFGRFQLTTDAFKPYLRWTRQYLGHRTDYAMLQKIYGYSKSKTLPTSGAEAHYSPAPIMEIHKDLRWGDPDRDMVCTSFVERFNLSMRMGIRRMTRLTNAFSKCWANHEAAIALYLAYYNFCSIHGTLGTTPACAAGITSYPWKISKLLDEAATHC